ncbi:kalirin-like isoform X2 [Ctenocephalides felis]|uniref:kalirin-like isoform X2 n=1 Tax=Ctenocephalides felis TaxID=7515 RepID=UPI000E6E3C4A|nr:kalirin-like isoform X2 [Ctenocephalides felis]
MSVITRNCTEMNSSRSPSPQKYFKPSVYKRGMAENRASRGSLRNTGARPISSWTARRPAKKGMISQRCQFFERLTAGADTAAPSATTASNHVYSKYRLPKEDDVTSQISGKSDNNESDASNAKDENSDNSGTTDAMTVNSTDLSEDYTTDPSEENSRQDYGFYNVFPGVPDEDLEPLNGIKQKNEPTKNSIEELRNDLNNEIDRMLGAAKSVRKVSGFSESEIVNKDVILDTNCNNNGTSSDNAEDNRKSAILHDLSCTIKELLTTEHSYIEDLDFICRTYMKEVETGDGVPENLQGKGAIIFGNIDKLKDFHKNEMYPALLKCNEDPESICKVFTSLIDKLYCYTEYALNKPHSEKLMKEGAQFFEKTRVAIPDVLGLNSFLLKPLQRLVKYRQLIERIGKNLKKLEIDEKVDYTDFRVKETVATVYSRELTAAIAAETALTELQQQGNDVLMVPFITKCQLPLESFRLLKTSKAIVNKRSLKYQIFLFENLILFTEPTIVNNEEFFTCKDYIYLDRILPPVECQKSLYAFTLTSSENKSRIFHIKCSSGDERSSWMTIIRNILFQQQQAWKEAMKNKLALSPTEASTKTAKDEAPKSVEIPQIKNCPIPRIDPVITGVGLVTPTDQRPPLYFRPHKLKDAGQLRKCGKLTIKYKNSLYIGHVTLYEKIVIFSSITNNHYEEMLKYESSILAENLGIAPNMGTSPTKFHVWCNKTNASYILQAKTEEAKAAWTKQFDKVVAEQEALRLRNSLAGRDVSSARKAGMRSLRGVPGECNRRSLPPVSTVWHMKFEFEEGQSSTTANEENENTKSKSQDLVPTSSISNVLGSLKNFASTTYASPKKNDLI